LGEVDGGINRIGDRPWVETAPSPCLSLSYYSDFDDTEYTHYYY
jgi:hypothetical protein